MSSDLVQKFPTLGECNRYTNGMCSTRSCLVRGGWKQGDAVDYDLATCETRDIRKTIEALEAEVAAYSKLVEKEAAFGIAQMKRAKAAEARAERLRVALQNIKAIGFGAATYKLGRNIGKAVEIARKALEAANEQ